MPIIKWEPIMSPFEEMEEMLSEFPTGKMHGFSPAVDVYQDKDNVYMEVPLAGVDPKDVEITVENDILTIKGEMKKESEVDEKNFYRKEIRGFFISDQVRTYGRTLQLCIPFCCKSFTQTRTFPGCCYYCGLTKIASINLCQRVE